MITFIHNCYGFQNFEEEKELIVRQMFLISAALTGFSMINNHLLMINKKLLVCGN